MDDLINDYLAYIKLKGKSPLTIRNYSAYLFSFSGYLNNIPIEQITINHIDGFHTLLQSKGLSLVTQSYYLIAIRTFLNYARVKRDINTLDPQKIDIPKFRRPIHDALSNDEIESLLNAAPLMGEYNIRARAIIEVLLCSGIRVCELVNMKVNEIDLKDKWFRVIGKGNKERVCFFNESAVTAIKKYLATRSIISPYLFTHYQAGNDGNKPISTRQIERLLIDYGKKAGVTEVYPHKIRRTFAVNLLRKNVDIRYIKEFLGHESIETTILYTKVERSDLEQIYRRASNKQVKDVKKENEQIILSRESFQKLSGMVGKTREIQNRILEKLEDKQKEIPASSIELPMKKPSVIN